MPTHGSQNTAKLSPGPRALPIIGYLHMLGKLPHQTFHLVAKTYGAIMSIKLGNVPAIVISSPQVAELFLKTHDEVFASRPRVQSAKYFSYGSTGLAFTEYGSYWRNVQRSETLHPATSECLKSGIFCTGEEGGAKIDGGVGKEVRGSERCGGRP